MPSVAATMRLDRGIYGFLLNVELWQSFEENWLAARDDEVALFLYLLIVRESTEFALMKKGLTPSINTEIIAEFATMKADVQYIKEKLDENNIQHVELKNMIEDFIKGADGRYASKNIEKAFYWTAGVAGSFFILTALKFIFG